MKIEQCPICGSELEIREVTPCIECGAFNEETEIVKEDIKNGSDPHHQSVSSGFALYRIFEKYEVTLCGFCAVDIGSFKPEYFGFSRDYKIGFNKLHLLKEIENPTIGKDKFCSECNLRLTFINFVLNVRNENAL